MKENNNPANYILAMIRDLMKFWYLISISLFLTCGIAAVYLKFSAKKYKIASTVVLNIEEGNSYGGGNPNDIMEVGRIIDQQKNFKNEIFMFNSTPLVREVIEDMDLRTTYYLQEDKIPKEFEFSLKDIYKDAPFIVIPDQNHIQPVETYFYIRIIDQESFFVGSDNREARVINFNTNETVLEKTNFKFGGTYKFGEQVGNAFCSFRILLNSNYRAELYQGKDLYFMYNDFKVLTAEFKGDLTVESTSLESTMVDLVFKSPNALKGHEFLNKLVSKYIQKNLTEKNFLANQTIEHIDRQISNISDSLGRTERQLQSFRSSASVMDIDEKAGNIYTQIQTLSGTREETSRRYSYLKQMDDYFTSNKDSSGLLAPSSMGLNDQMLNNLIQELTALNSEKQQIISAGQLQNPRLQTLDVSIRNLKEAITENIKFSISTTRNELNDLNSKINNLEREFSKLPYTQQRLLGIERKFDINQGVYSSLLEKRIQAQIIKSSNLADCELIEPPHFVSIASPKTLVVLILALMVGFLIPISFIFGKRIIGDRFLDFMELKKYVDTPQIGVIPVNKNAMNNVVLEYPHSAIAESFHTIRSNLIYYLMGKDKGTILVTSSIPEEGKSFSALNLATSFASTNNKTVLLEFDLRKPSAVYSELGTRALVGISSYLINRVTLDEIIIKTEIPNLDIIQTGQVPPNPVELLSSKKNQELFNSLRERYDYIIIDTPPYGLVSDAFILMKYADIKLYVTRLGKVKRSRLISSMEDVVSKGVKDIYLLVNEDSTFKNSTYQQYTERNKGKKAGAKKARKRRSVKPAEGSE